MHLALITSADAPRIPSIEQYRTVVGRSSARSAVCLAVRSGFVMIGLVTLFGYVIVSTYVDSSFVMTVALWMAAPAKSSDAFRELCGFLMVIDLTRFLVL